MGVCQQKPWSFHRAAGDSTSLVMTHFRAANSSHSRKVKNSLGLGLMDLVGVLVPFWRWRRTRVRIRRDVGFDHDNLSHHTPV